MFFSKSLILPGSKFHIHSVLSVTAPAESRDAHHGALPAEAAHPLEGRAGMTAAHA